MKGILTSIYNVKWAFILTLVYAVLLIVLSLHHEPSRDEVRALSIAINNRSVPALFSYLHYEGHPGLWYLILRVAYRVIGSTVVLKLSSVIIAIGSVFIFLRKAPFPRYQKILYLFGSFPLYYYSVYSRSYGLAMLLLFIFCAAYRSRFERPILIASILFLFVNTHAYAIVIAIAICLSLFAEYFQVSRHGNKLGLKKRDVCIAGAIALTGILVSLSQIIPWETNTAIRACPPDLDSVYTALYDVLSMPGLFFGDIFWHHNYLLTSIVIWLLFVRFLKKPTLFIILFLSVIGLGMSFRLIYGGSIIHKGFFYYIVIAIFWLDNLKKEEVRLSLGVLDRLAIHLSGYKNAFFSLILISQICMAYPAIKTDLLYPSSSSKAFGQFLSEHPGFNNAIIISEPDYTAESIPYYADNRIYLPREKRFSMVTKNGLAGKRELSLKEYFDTAVFLEGKYKVPVLMLLGDRLEKAPSTISRGRKGPFVVSKDSLKIFRDRTKKIAQFRNSRNDENYDVYVLKKGE